MTGGTGSSSSSSSVGGGRNSVLQAALPEESVQPLAATLATHLFGGMG